jgi:hypothetical protein
LYKESFLYVPTKELVEDRRPMNPLKEENRWVYEISMSKFSKYTIPNFKVGNYTKWHTLPDSHCCCLQVQFIRQISRFSGHR